MSQPYEQTVELVLHNTLYIVHAYTKDDTLYIEAEQKSDGSQWTGEFTIKCKHTFLVLFCFIFSPRATSLIVVVVVVVVVVFCEMHDIKHTPSRD